jgi:hypothetical protein
MRKLSVLVLALAMASPMVLGQQADQAGDRPGDAELTKRVKAALIDDETTKARQSNVETRNGVVQLSGFVDSEEMKEAALTRAKSVPGIAEVRNDLVVRESERTVERFVCSPSQPLHASFGDVPTRHHDARGNTSSSTSSQSTRLSRKAGCSGQPISRATGDVTGGQARARHLVQFLSVNLSVEPMQVHR